VLKQDLFARRKSTVQSLLLKIAEHVRICERKHALRDSLRIEEKQSVVTNFVKFAMRVFSTGSLARAGRNANSNLYTSSLGVASTPSWGKILVPSNRL
jgi:hypothetical protein